MFLNHKDQQSWSNHINELFSVSMSSGVFRFKLVSKLKQSYDLTQGLFWSFQLWSVTPCVVRGETGWQQNGVYWVALRRAPEEVKINSEAEQKDRRKGCKTPEKNLKNVFVYQTISEYRTPDDAAKEFSESFQTFKNLCSCLLFDHFHFSGSPERHRLGDVIIIYSWYCFWWTTPLNRAHTVHHKH